MSDDYKFVVNIGLSLDESKDFYLFGNYGERNVLGGFFFRNPTNRGGVFSTDGGATRLVGDVAEATTGAARTCPVVPVPATGAGSSTDTALAAIKADPNCFVFNEMWPGGFTPSFGGDVMDWSIASGVTGTTDSGTFWDVSVSVGAVSYTHLTLPTKA